MWNDITIEKTWSDSYLRVESSLISSSNKSVKSWIRFDSLPATPVINGSFNVSSLTDLAAGNLRVNFATNLINNLYTVLTSSSGTSNACCTASAHAVSDITIWTGNGTTEADKPMSVIVLGS